MRKIDEAGAVILVLSKEEQAALITELGDVLAAARVAAARKAVNGKVNEDGLSLARLTEVKRLLIYLTCKV